MTTHTKFTPVPRAFQAFNMAYEARVLHRDENDQLEPDAYERFTRFWSQVEQELLPDYVKAEVDALFAAAQEERAQQRSNSTGLRVDFQIDGEQIARMALEAASRGPEQPPQHEPDHRTENAAQQAADQHGMAVPDGFLNAFPVVLFFAGLLIGAALALLFKVA